MSKTNKVRIPKKYKSFDDKIDFLFKKIRLALSEFEGIEKAGAEQAILIGHWCSLMKKVVKKSKKGRWQKFIKDRFPSLPIRTVQRYMKIARKVDPKEYPALAFLGKTRLYDLAALAGKEGKMADLLHENNIDLDIDLTEQDQIHSLKSKVDELLDQEKTPAPPADVDEDNAYKESKKKSGKTPKFRPSLNGKKGRGIVDRLEQDAASLMKAMESAMESAHVFKRWPTAISKVVKEVEATLTALKEYQ